MINAKDILILGTIIVYLLSVLWIGFRCTKQNKGTDDFYLGGRKLGPFVTAMSAEASDMSSWLLLGLPGVAYLCGLADATWTAIGLAVGTYVNWLIVAKRIRRYSVKLKAITIPEFFSFRYRDSKNVLQLIAAIVIIVFFIPYTASGFAACGKLFASMFGLDYHASMIVSAVIILSYTTLGGFLAASTTDFMQSIIMTIAIITILGFGVTVAGGVDTVIANAKELPGYLSLVQSYNATSGQADSYGFITIVSTLAWGLGYFGMPHILLRFMATKDEKKLKLSRRIASVWVVISMAVAILIGVVGYSVSKTGAVVMLEGTDSEKILMYIAQLLSNYGWLAAIIAGIILAGVLAATMSTADSQLLAAASAVSQNIITGVLKIKLSEKKQMIFARATVVLISIFAVVLAWDQNSSVFKIVSFSWAGFGAAFGPVVLFALFWKRSTFQGAVAGMISGGVMVFVWKFLVRPLGGAWNIYELLPAFIVACIAIVVVSLVSKEPSKEITDEFEAVRCNK